MKRRRHWPILREVPPAARNAAPLRAAVAVAVWAPAKINLHLEVLARRPDGYHEIATLMLAVDRFDTLEFRLNENSHAIELTCDRPELSTGPENLVCRAAEALRQAVGRSDLAASIHLTKRIPLAAGLAGGSSDAAATLLGLNRLWKLGWRTEELARLAAELGSDIPFFFALPAAWCTGRGEVVEPVEVGRALDVVLVSPPIGVSTALAYRGVRVPLVPQSGDAIRQALRNGDIEAIGRLLHNRLQESAEAICPMIAEVRRVMENMGVGHVLMSGSGSTLFCLCRNRREAFCVAKALREGRSGLPLGTQVTVARSCV